MTSSPFSLQLLHFSDAEGGVDAIANAPNFVAIADFLETQATDVPENTNTVTISAGDNYISGPFFGAAGVAAGAEFEDTIYTSVIARFLGIDEAILAQDNELEVDGGRVDVAILNILGLDASALGNHEFDLGSNEVSVIAGVELSGGQFDPTADPSSINGLGAVEHFGAFFTYLSANLDFSADIGPDTGQLGEIFTSEILSSTAFAPDLETLDGFANDIGVAPSTIIDLDDGNQLGVIGLTTPLLEIISSPGLVDVIDPESNDIAGLAAIVNAEVARLQALGVENIILASHLQQFALESELAPLLEGVDIIIAGGSDTILADETDTLFPGTEVDIPEFPVLTTGADDQDIAIVSTDGEYRFLGRLVVDFDGEGNIDPSSIDPNVSGAFETSNAGVLAVTGADPDFAVVDDATGTISFAEDSKADLVQELTNGINDIVVSQDGNTIGFTDVFIDGRRDDVRTEETTLGNLRSDANLFLAQMFDPTVTVSLGNGGGIRDSIGETVDSGDGVTFTLEPPQDNPGVPGDDAGTISELDINNVLRFNNGLVLQTVTREQLLELVENGVAATAPGATPGQFAQVGGLRYSFDATLPVGERILSLAIVDEDGIAVDIIASGGEFVGDPSAPVRLVTLDFLQNGGDGFPFDVFAEADPEFADVVFLEEQDPSVFVDNVPVFDPGSEQDALAEFVNANFGTPDTAFAEVESEDISTDLRVQDVNVRIEAGLSDDAVIQGGPLFQAERFVSTDGAIRLTVSDFDRDTLTESGDFVSEGLVFTPATSQDPGVVAIERLFNPESFDHTFAVAGTTAELEAAGFVNEGLRFFGFADAASAPADAIPVLQFQEEDGELFLAAGDEVSALQADPTLTDLGTVFFAFA